MMDPARWERVQSLFHRVVELSPAERAAYLRSACADDPALASEVEGLLVEDARASGVLDGGVARAARDVLGTAGLPGLPEALGPYRIVRLLGEGGMGVVYLAERADLGNRVAIKVLRDAWLSPARRERFAAEQRTLAQLDHPSIARLYDADSLPDGTPWFVMEYVEGIPLTDYCRVHETSLEGRLELFRSVCEAVQHAHGHAVIHRDLKPSNILVRGDGTVKLLDFGIAKHVEDLDGTVDQTRTVLRLMTPAYAAPEQVRGQRVGVHSDVYSLGVILYELLTGRPPHDLSRLTPAEALSAVVEREPARPSAAAAEPGGHAPRARRGGRASWSDLDVLCLTAMHKEPRRRYPTVEALARDVSRYLAGEPLLARPDDLAYRLRKLVRRNRKAVLAAAAMVVIVFTLVTFYTVRLTRARDEALAEAARTERIQRFMTRLFEGGESEAAPAEDLRVLTLVERGVQEARSLDAEPVVQAELYGTLGRIYRSLGELDRADELLRSALDRGTTLLGAEHPDTAESRIDLGLLRSDQAEYEEAERLCRDGLATLERSLPDDHPTVANALASLGHVLVERGSYEDAQRTLEAAVKIQEREGPDTPELAASLFELANAHFYAGHLDEAQALSERVLGMSRRIYGEGHPSAAEDLINLGAIAHERGDYVGAESKYREALAITRAWYGEDHTKTASNMIMLARALLFQDRFDEAQQTLEGAIAIQERVFGPNHPRVASAMNEIGSIALQRDDYDKAETVFRRITEIYRKAYPEGHYLIGIALSNLASVYMARKQYALAEPLFREAIGIYLEKLSPENLNVGIARIKLGRTLLRQERWADALEQTIAGYEIMSKQADPAVSWITAAKTDLVAAYERLGRPQEAAKYR
jgi:serine/threonine-protein kinase